MENNKNFSAELNLKPKIRVGWTIAFLGRPLSNKEVISSTKVNLGDYKMEMTVIFTQLFSLI